MHRASAALIRRDPVPLRQRAAYSRKLGSSNDFRSSWLNSSTASFIVFATSPARKPSVLELPGTLSAWGPRKTFESTSLFFGKRRILLGVGREECSREAAIAAAFPLQKSKAVAVTAVGCLPRCCCQGSQRGDLVALAHGPGHQTKKRVTGLEGN